jgi:hypothetical protein
MCGGAIVSKHPHIINILALLEFLVFQIGNSSKKTKFGQGPKRPFIVLDKSNLTCPM